MPVDVLYQSMVAPVDGVAVITTVPVLQRLLLVEATTVGRALAVAVTGVRGSEDTQPVVVLRAWAYSSRIDGRCSIGIRPLMQERAVGRRIIPVDGGSGRGGGGNFNTSGTAVICRY